MMSLAVYALLAAVSFAQAQISFLGGVNTAGYDFSVVSSIKPHSNKEVTDYNHKSTDGSFTGTGVSPPVEQFSHFSSQGVNIFRIRE